MLNQHDWITLQNRFGSLLIHQVMDQCMRECGTTEVSVIFALSLIMARTLDEIEILRKEIAQSGCTKSRDRVT